MTSGHGGWQQPAGTYQPSAMIAAGIAFDYGGGDKQLRPQCAGANETPACRALQHRRRNVVRAVRPTFGPAPVEVEQFLPFQVDATQYM